MTTHSKSVPTSRWLLSSFVLLIITLGAASSGQAQIPDLVVTVGDTTGTSGEKNSVVSVFMDNVFDSICGFELWLKISRPDIMEFQTDIDTFYDTSYWVCTQDSSGICIDSMATTPESAEWFNVDVTIATVGSVDTSNTLISGWELVRSGPPLDPSSTLDIKVTGQANLLEIFGTTPGIAPQQGGLLFKLLADIFNIPDTLTDRTAFIEPKAGQANLQHFNFSTCDGRSLGVTTVYPEDTNCYHCTAWAPPPNENFCTNWIQVACDDPVFDSLTDSTSVKIDTIAVFDSTKAKLYTGSLTVLSGVCGDLDCDEFGNVDIVDLTVLIDHLFITFSPLCSSKLNSNIDCDQWGNVDIIDLTVLIDHLFITFDPLCCDL